MVDSKARVALKGVAQVLPKGVDAFARMERAERIDPALRDEPPIRLANLGPEERIIDPALGCIDVEFGRCLSGCALRHFARLAAGPVS